MKKHFLLAIAIILLGCGKGSSSHVPGAATLLSPLQNQICTSGTVISLNQSSILFTWDASQNTDSYLITITNLLTQAVITQTVTTAQATVTLLRNTPYSWYITSQTSKSSSTTKSSIWKFYNSGAGVVTYAPFPAEITSPLFNQAVTATAGKTNLTWTGSSVSNNIVGYDVYFGASNNPPIVATQITDSFLNGVSVTSGTTYYWHVTTVDSNGNYSDSGTYQFSVN